MNAPTDTLPRQPAADLPPGGDLPSSPNPQPAADSAAAPPPVRLGRLFLILAVLAIVGLIVGFIPRWKNRAEVRNDTADLALPTVSVVSAAPAKAPPALALSGEIRPLVETSITARANGYVSRWLVDLGAQVKAGDLLAELDTPEIGRQLAQAKAELAQAEAARDLSGTTAKRWRELLAGKTVSSQEADEKANDLELKKANVEAARANVQRLEDVSSFARITAPFSGTITARAVDVGQLVTANSGESLFRLAQTDRLRVFVRVPQAFSRSVSPDQIAQLTVPELPGREFEAKVVRTAGALDPATRTLLTELQVENPKGELLSGGFAQVRLPDAKAEAAVTLPANTVFFRPEGAYIAVVNGSTAALHKVALGRDFGAVVEILSGVQPGDHVILNPADSMSDGTEVRMVEQKVDAQ